MLSPEEERELAELEELAALEAQAADVGAGRRKAAVSGAATGLVGGTLGAPGDVGELVETGRKAAGIPRLLNIPSIMSLLPTTEKIVGTADEAFGTEFGYKPRTPEEEYTKSITAGASGAALPGGKISASTRAIMGGLAGGAGEAVNQLTNNPMLGALTNIAAMLTGGRIAARKPQAVKAVQKDLANIPESELAAADARAAQMEKDFGVRPVLSQAFDDPNALGGIANEVARSPHGQVLQKVLGRQMTVGQEKVDALVQGLSKRTLGQRDANEVLTAGEKAIERPAKVASASAARDYKRGKKDVLPVREPTPNKTVTVEERVHPVYDEQGNFVTNETEILPPKTETRGTTYEGSPVGGDRTNWTVHKVTVDDLITRLYTRAEELSLDGGNKAAKPFYEAAQNVERLSRRYPDGIPAGHLDVIQRQAATKARLADVPGAREKTVLNKETQQSVSGIFNDVLKEISPSLKEGKGKFSRWMEAYDKKVQQSPLTTMFTEEARKAGKGDFDEMTKVLRNSSAYKPEDIAFVAHNLHRADPEAFPMLVKQAWSKARDEANLPERGRTPQQAMNDWVNDVAGAPGSKARANALEAIKQIAISRGQDPQLAAQAADTLFDNLHRISRERQSVGQVNAGEMRTMAGQNPVSGSIRSISMVPRWPMAKALEQHLYAKTYAQLADALVSPEGFKKLLEIAQFDPTMVKMEEYARALLAANAYQEAQ